FVLVAAAQHAQDGPEDLLPRDAHRVVDAGEQRRLDVPAARKARGASAAHAERRALLASAPHVALDAGPLALRDERSELRLRIEGVADLLRCDRLREPLDDPAVHLAGGDDA